jgi:hypothetical protein
VRNAPAERVASRDMCRGVGAIVEGSLKPSEIEVWRIG